MKIKFNLGGVFSMINWYQWYNVTTPDIRIAPYSNSFFDSQDNFILEYDIPDKNEMDEFTGEIFAGGAETVAKKILEIFHKIK